MIALGALVYSYDAPAGVIAPNQHPCQALLLCVPENHKMKRIRAHVYVCSGEETEKIARTVVEI